VAEKSLLEFELLNNRLNSVKQCAAHVRTVTRKLPQFQAYI
jgi:hypothetical protein